VFGEVGRDASGMAVEAEAKPRMIPDARIAARMTKSPSAPVTGTLGQKGHPSFCKIRLAN